MVRLDACFRCRFRACIVGFECFLGARSLHSGLLIGVA